jgi:hypothetical protein
MSMAAHRQYFAVALKQGEIVASKSQAKIVGAASNRNARMLASKFITAAIITSSSALWSFATLNLLIANLALTHLGVTQRRFSRSARQPGRASRCLHAGCRSVGLRTSIELIPEEGSPPGFDIT